MPPTDPSHSLFSDRAPLAALFAPRRVALVGASETAGSVGRRLAENLAASRVPWVPVNPRRQRVLGQTAAASVETLDEQADLAVVAVPAPDVPAVLAACGRRGVRAAAVVSAGFREAGPVGRALEADTIAAARLAGVRLLGPNSLGFVRPHLGLNASLVPGDVRPGRVALLSQSGSLLSAVADWGAQQHMGFSALVSLGSMADVGWGEAIDFFGSDAHTKSILLYMESVGDARAFLSAAREVAFQKPILVLRAGRSDSTAGAITSHTGALAGSDRVLDAALRRSGMLRVNTVAGLFYTAETLAKQPPPRGPRLAICSNAGAPALLAADALLEDGGSLAELGPASRAALPPNTAPENPVDLLHDADAARYQTAIAALADDAGVDGILTILTPQLGLDPLAVAEAMAATGGRKPLLASWVGGGAVQHGEDALNAAGIPTFPFPDTPARVFAAMWRLAYNLRGLYETPTLPPDQPGLPDRDAARAALAPLAPAGRTRLAEHEAKALLAAYGVPAVATLPARDLAEARLAARTLGFPVAVKILAPGIVHKRAAGGVQLHVRDEPALEEAFATIRAAAPAGDFEGVTVQRMVDDPGIELLVGATVDADFGPVLSFGAGGRLAEVHDDVAFGLPPLNTTLARRMMEQTRIGRALDEAAVEAVAALLVRFSQLITEWPRLRELEINPLLATDGGALLALDARGMLFPPDIPAAELPRPAIRPYPGEFVEAVTLTDGRRATVRPIRPEDEPLLVRFHEELGDETVYLRYASLMQLDRRVAHERLARRCFIDYDREMALVVEVEDAGERSLLAIGRLTKLPGTASGEFGLLVLDRAQGTGIGTIVLERLVRYGRAEGLERIVAEILARNRPMQRVAEKVGFTLVASDDFSDPMVQAVRVLSD